MSRKRYALVGTGGRSGMFLKAVTRKFEAHAELVGLCDRNIGRMKYWRGTLPEAYQELGRLLNELGETDAAADAYRDGLGLVAGESLPAVPLLESSES